MLKTIQLSITDHAGFIGTCTILSLTALVFTGCSMQKEKSQAAQQTELSIVYMFTAEATYDRIEISQNKLIYTYFDDLENKAASWMKQEPVWTQQDLKNKEVTLTNDEIDDLLYIIDQTNFWLLKDTYGGASSNQRYYPHSLSVSLGSENKKVVYQSFPDAEPMPDAQKAIIDKLHELVKAKF